MAVASGPAGPVLAGPVLCLLSRLLTRRAALMGVAPRELLRCHDHSARGD